LPKVTSHCIPHVPQDSVPNDIPSVESFASSPQTLKTGRVCLCMKNAESVVAHDDLLRIIFASTEVSITFLWWILLPDFLVLWELL
jgi:hypothetical protein